MTGAVPPLRSSSSAAIGPSAPSAPSVSTGFLATDQWAVHCHPANEDLPSAAVLLRKS